MIFIVLPQLAEKKSPDIFLNYHHLFDLRKQELHSMALELQLQHRCIMLLCLMELHSEMRIN